MAGPNDFTGQFISSTFQRVLQLSGSGEITDGTGSLVSFLPITTSYAYTASYATQAADIVVSVLNQSGAQINKGAVVHISGSNNNSDIPRVRLADWTNDSFSANTLGLALTNIPNGELGQVITDGLFIGYNTSAWDSGQLLYLGPNGTITGSAPQAPLHAVRLGQVIRVNQNNGSIYVRIDNGYEIDELHNVRITSTPSTGDVLVYSGSVWTNVPGPDAKERRYDSSGSYSYCGVAPFLSTEANNSWSITRILIYSDGSTLINSASSVDWTNRYTHTYY